jgi:lactase-phlorizin hydrolase
MQIHTFFFLLVGIIGITMNTDWQVPKNPSDPKDLAASDRAINFMFGWFLNPVIRGDYPQVMKEQVGRKSKEQGHTSSRLPVFTPNEKLFIKGNSLSTHAVFSLYQ